MKKCLIIIAITALILLFVSCKKTSTNSETSIIKVAHTQTYVPYTYIDDKQESQGFEVEIWRLFDEFYPQYEVQFVPTAEEDLLLGVEAHKYNAGIKGVWKTAQREQKYLFSKQYIAASVIGLTFRKQDENTIHDLVSFAQYSGNLVPISPQSAQYALIEDFNKKNPATPIKLTPADSFNIPESYPWVLEGRYDGFLDLQLSFERKVTKEDGAYHEFVDKLSFVPYQAVPTWVLFNKEETALANDFDSFMIQLHENGEYSDLCQKFFGSDISTLIER